MNLLPFKWPSRENMAVLKDYWQYILIGAFFMLLISSNIYLMMEQKKTDEKVNAIQAQFVSYVMTDHVEMKTQITDNSSLLKDVAEMLEKALSVGKENNEFLRELRNQRH